MINNNPYNIPEKKPLSQSKIISDTNSSRHSSTYVLNRNGNEVMYSSSIFLKNPSVNGGCDQSFFEPLKQPLSPHHAKYSKAPSTVQFIPAAHLPPMRPPENHFFPVSATKQNFVERTLLQLKDKIEKIEKRLDAKEMKEFNSNHLQSKKPQKISENDSLTLLTEDSSNNGNSFRQLVSLMIDEALESQNKKIWKKLVQIEEQTAFSLNNNLGQKVSILEESVFRLKSQKPHYDEQFANRLKTIEKTIREMGQDIHLIHDKEVGLSAKVDHDLEGIKNDLKILKGNEKKTLEFEKKQHEAEKKVMQTDRKTIQTDRRLTEADKKLVQIKGLIDQVSKRLKSVEAANDPSLPLKIKELESKLQGLRSQQREIRPTLERYLSQPCILKYIQKYQVSKPYNHSHSSSTKDSCQQIVINDITYYIDHEGYLLDNDRYYLTNSAKNERVRLDAKHIDLLKERKMLI